MKPKNVLVGLILTTLNGCTLGNVQPTLILTPTVITSPTPDLTRAFTNMLLTQVSNSTQTFLPAFITPTSAATATYDISVAATGTALEILLSHDASPTAVPTIAQTEH